MQKIIKDMELFENILEDYGSYQMPSFEDFDSEDMTTLYRVAFSDQIPSIFKYGYDREFTGSKGGNMYGPGVYCTFVLADTIHNVETKSDEYGDCIVKMRLIGGFDRFLIFDEQFAKQIYGDKWRIKDQLVSLTNNDTKVINTIGNVMRNSEVNPHRTAPAAYNVWLYLRKSIYRKYNIRGLIYIGGRDGRCALPYDFSSIIPYAVSYDQGKTFVKKFNKALYDRMHKSIDSEFRYGGKYKKVFKPIDGYCAVVNKEGKWNYVDINTDQEISPVWFDSIQSPVNNGEFIFTYDGVTFTGDAEEQCVYEMGMKWFNFSELPTQVPIIKEREKAFRERKKQNKLKKQLHESFDNIFKKIMEY